MKYKLSNLETLLLDNVVKIKTEVKAGQHLDFFNVKLLAKVNDDTMKLECFVSYDSYDVLKAVVISFEYGNDTDGYILGFTPEIMEYLYDKSIESAKAFLQNKRREKKNIIKQMFCF
jgi:hypothetical protein